MHGIFVLYFCLEDYSLHNPDFFWFNNFSISFLIILHFFQTKRLISLYFLIYSTLKTSTTITFLSPVAVMQY